MVAVVLSPPLSSSLAHARLTSVFARFPPLPLACSHFGGSDRIVAEESCNMIPLSRPPTVNFSFLNAATACAGRALINDKWMVSSVSARRWNWDPASVGSGTHVYKFNRGRQEGCSYRAFRAAWGDDFAVGLRSLVRAVATPTEVDTGFEQMIAETKRKYYMLGGKGGVGKTSLAAALAVKFANSGHSTLVVSTDPAHSLSDSFAQDLTGGMPVLVEGPDSLLFAMEIEPEQARAEFRASSQTEGSSGVKDFMDSLGLGAWVEQLSELKLGELLDTPPPGLDEAIAIAKVVQFMEAPEYSKFTRIVFDTAPTGHTLRLLSLPDFLDASIGKILKLKQKLASATAAIKSVFGQSNNEGDRATGKLELLKERMVMVREIFRNKETTEFVIVTIPTVMAVNESSRLQQSLMKESVPVKRLIVNQILPPSSTDCKFCNIKRKDQQKAIEMIRNHSTLRNLQLIESPLFDLEIRGVPALRIMGDLVWQ